MAIATASAAADAPTPMSWRGPNLRHLPPHTGTGSTADSGHRGSLRSARADRGEVARGAHAEHQRRDDGTQSAVDIGEFRGQRPAPLALVQMRLDLHGLTLRQPATRPRAEPVDRRPAPFAVLSAMCTWSSLA